VPHGFQDASVEQATIRDWWARAPAANVAIVMGPPSGLFAVDVDPRNGGDKTLVALEAQHGPLPSTLRAHTGGGGEHIFFRLPQGAEVRSGAHRLGQGLDVKAGGGYVIAAPSIHPDGGLYTWSSEDAPADAPAWLLELASTPPTLTSGVPFPAASGPRRADAMTRASAYLATMPPAISGSGGHQATWSAALALVRGFDLDPGSALYLLEREFNLRCQPPWARRDLEHKVTSAARANVAVGYLLEDDRRPWTPPPWRPRPELVCDYQGPPEDAPQEGPTPQEPLRGLARLARVALLGRERIIDKATEPVAYVWQDIAVAGTIVLLAGGPSEGKTTLLFLLLVARANLGEPVKLLGRDVQPAPQERWIVLIEGEHGEVSTSRKLVRSCALLGVHDLALTRLVIIARKAVKLGSPEWADIETMVAAGIVSDIAIDTVARVAPGDANDEREQVAIFDIIAQAIERAPEGKHPTAWCCAHTRKNGTGGLEDVAGSAQRVGQADSVLLVKGKKEAGRTVSSTVTFAKLREDPEEYPEPVTWAIVRRQDGSRALTLGGADPPDERPLEARLEELLTAGPQTKNALATRLARSAAAIDAAISTLFAVRRIELGAPVSIRGREFKTFQLRQDAPSMTRSATPD
jgi:hypothetical protein